MDGVSGVSVKVLFLPCGFFFSGLYSNQCERDKMADLKCLRSCCGILDWRHFYYFSPKSSSCWSELLVKADGQYQQMPIQSHTCLAAFHGNSL